MTFTQALLLYYDWVLPFMVSACVFAGAISLRRPTIRPLRFYHADWDWPLLRCAIVVGMAELVANMVIGTFTETRAEGAVALIAINLTAMVAVMIRPAGLIHAVFGSIFLAAWVSKVLFYYSNQSDHAYMVSWTTGTSLAIAHGLLLFLCSGGRLVQILTRYLDRHRSGSLLQKT